jgi:hypothetical protein
MDTSDAKITFDARGWCEYCNNYFSNILPHWHPDERGVREIEPQMEKIKVAGRGRDHDCLIGISGGVDSSYVTYLAKARFGLRPLLFHVDAGWNSQQAVNNIERLVDGLSVDLHTEVIDWEEMKDLQLAFFRAQVPHIDTPQDHAFFAALYNFAAKHGFKYILTRLLDRVHPRAAGIALSPLTCGSSGHPSPLRHAAVEVVSDRRHLQVQALLPVHQGRQGRQAAEPRALHQRRGDAGARR